MDLFISQTEDFIEESTDFFAHEKQANVACNSLSPEDFLLLEELSVVGEDNTVEEVILALHMYRRS